MASVAGFLPGPGMAVYYATKAYVLSFSEALHHELKPRGVRVTALCPGPVPTEFQARAGMRPRRPSAALTRSAERVAQEGYRGFKEGRRVVVPGFANKLVTALIRLVPHSILLKAAQRSSRAAAASAGPDMRSCPESHAQSQAHAGFISGARAGVLQSREGG